MNAQMTTVLPMLCSIFTAIVILLKNSLYFRHIVWQLKTERNFSLVSHSGDTDTRFIERHEEILIEKR